MGKIRVIILLFGLFSVTISATFLFSNLSEERAAEMTVKQELLEIRKIVQESEEIVENEPEMQQNETESQEESKAESAREYVGILTIPALEKTLPVRSDWSETLLKSTPCCYFGNISDGIVIAGHNYRSHFSGLATLKPGDPLLLQDLSGSLHRYQVVQTEILNKQDVEAMKDPRWPLTLFTCTNGGEKRVTVRCEKMT